MYTGLLHTHRLSVILFLLLFVVKLVLLLANRKETLEKFNGKTKIPERIIEVLFLLTGLVMVFQAAEITTLMIIKFAMVAASIPLAIIGFKKENKILATIAVLLIVGTYGLAEANKIGFSTDALDTAVVTNASDANYDLAAHGKALYERNCIACHGAEGNGKLSGAKDLTISEVSEPDMVKLVTNGKNSMPPYGRIYSPEEISAVVAYVRGFKK